MANIKFSREEVEKYFKLDEKNLDKIMMLGIPVESITSEDIEIQILPNRPDLLSMQGFIRAVIPFLTKDSSIKQYKVNPPEKNFKVEIDNSLKNIRPFTSCAIVKGIKFTDSRIKEIIDMQEKLHTTAGRNRKKFAIGIYPLEKITFPIKFEAISSKDIKFIPLESDREMTGLEIIQRHPTGKEYAHLLEGLSKFPVFKDAKGKILSMPPIINSNETGKVTENTQDVFVECSGFDFQVLNKILSLVVTTLSDMGGKIFGLELNYSGKKVITPNLTCETCNLSLENTNKLLGLELKESDLPKLLQKMGYNYKNKKVQVPPWRTDVLHEVDVIEDIAISYGYENLTPEIPKVSTVGEESKSSKFHTKLSEILAGLGLLEISSYYLIKSAECAMMKIQEDVRIEVQDSKTEYKFLRPNLIIPALRILSENKDNEYPQKIFEIGTIFKKDQKQETGIKESEHLVIATSPGNFTELKQILDYLSKMLDLSYTLKEIIHDSLIDGRSAQIIINNKPLGIIGEVHPQTLKDWGIKMPVSLIEINIDNLI